MARDSHVQVDHIFAVGYEVQRSEEPVERNQTARSEISARRFEVAVEHDRAGRQTVLLREPSVKERVELGGRALKIVRAASAEGARAERVAAETEDERDRTEPAVIREGRSVVGDISAVVLREIVEGLVVTAQTDVVREVPVWSRSARLYSELVVEGVRSEAAVDVGVAREGTGLDDLVDETGDAVRSDRRRTAAGVDFELLQAEARPSRRRVVIERTVDGNTVVLEPAEEWVRAVNDDGLIPAHAAGSNDQTRRRGDRRVDAVQVTAAADGRRGLDLSGVDLIEVAADTGLNQRGASLRRNVRNDLERFAHGQRELLRLVGKDRDARERDILIPAFG